MTFGNMWFFEGFLRDGGHSFRHIFVGTVQGEKSTAPFLAFLSSDSGGLQTGTIDSYLAIKRPLVRGLGTWREILHD
jgi:hypothetical protein